MFLVLKNECFVVRQQQSWSRDKRVSPRGPPRAQRLCVYSTHSWGPRAQHPHMKRWAVNRCKHTRNCKKNKPSNVSVYSNVSPVHTTVRVPLFESVSVTPNPAGGEQTQRCLSHITLGGPTETDSDHFYCLNMMAFGKMVQMTYFKQN